LGNRKAENNNRPRKIVQFHQKSIRAFILSWAIGMKKEAFVCLLFSLNLSRNNTHTQIPLCTSIKLTFFILSQTFQIVAGISVFFICTSVISFCLKTLPAMRVEIPMTTIVSNHTGGPMNMSDFYQMSTTEANFLTTTPRPSGLFNRYSVNNLICSLSSLLPTNAAAGLLLLLTYCFEWGDVTLRELKILFLEFSPSRHGREEL
jgi:hypothetical protein